MNQEEEDIKDKAELDATKSLEFIIENEGDNYYKIVLSNNYYKYYNNTISNNYYEFYYNELFEEYFASNYFNELFWIE
uniref:Uncharacterized protein n=1 Tax=viral metagenome TaxID=1070528 RepID=A0A6C0H4P7_9ZZZZ